VTSREVDQVSVVVTGLGWMKRGVRSIGSTIEDLIANASDEIQIAVYLVTPGASDFVQLLESSLKRGLRISFIINSFSSQPEEVQQKFLELTAGFSNFLLFDFLGSEREALHAKIIVVDRRVAFIGSSNLTWGGLTLNHEIGVRVEGPAAKKIANLVDCLEKDRRTKRIGYRIA
jgi:cardiolipin synthase